MEVLDKILNSEHNFAFTYLNICYNYLICFNKEILTKIHAFKIIKFNFFGSLSLENENLVLDLLIDLEKLYTLCIFLGYGYFVDEKDIFNQDINSEDWKNITKISYEVICSGEKDIQKKFKLEAENSALYASSLLNSYNENSFGITNATSFLSKYYLYIKHPKIKEIEGKSAQLIQNKNMTTELMLMVKWPIFKKLTEREFPSIKYRKKFYIKKEYPDITLEYIQNLLKLMGNNIPTEECFKKQSK